MIRIVKTIVKIVGYVILNSISGLVLSLLFYVLIGNVKISILLFILFFIGGLILNKKKKSIPSLSSKKVLEGKEEKELDFAIDLIIAGFLFYTIRIIVVGLKNIF